MAAKPGTVTLEWDHGAVRTVIGGYALEASYAAAEVFIQRAVMGIYQAGPVNTGAMADGFELEVSGDAMRPEVTVYNKMPYTIYQERGTQGSQARPGGTLRFSVGGRVVFARKTGPIAAGNFMLNAINGLRPEDFVPR